MLTLLFWNLGRSERAVDLLASAAVKHQPDIVAVAECPVPAERVVEKIAALGNDCFMACPRGPINERVTIWTRSTVACSARPVIENEYVDIRTITGVGRDALLLAVCHNVSLRNADAPTVNEEATHVARLVREAEKAVGHRRTIFVGDMNLCPFEDAMIKPEGFMGVMDRRIAQEGCKHVKFRDHQMFYNPMWGMMGDLTGRPPGTYYYYRAGHHNYFWHTYDQVLLRPELLPAFAPSGLAVLDHIGPVPLLDETGRPDPIKASDHLPIVLRLAW